MRRILITNRSWVDSLDRVLELYNSTRHRATGLKPIVIFKGHDPELDLLRQNLTTNINLNDIYYKLVEYVRKWSQEYLNRAISPAITVGDRVLLCNNYNLNRRSAYSVIYNTTVYVVLEINGYNALIQTVRGENRKTVHFMLLKKYL